jgi:hypothetical protein
VLAGFSFLGILLGVSDRSDRRHGAGIVGVGDLYPSWPPRGSILSTPFATIEDSQGGLTAWLMFCIGALVEEIVGPHVQGDVNDIALEATHFPLLRGSPMAPTPDTSNHFVLEMFDRTLWCPTAQALFYPIGVAPLRSILGLGAAEEGTSTTRCFGRSWGPRRARGRPSSPRRSTAISAISKNSRPTSTARGCGCSAPARPSSPSPESASSPSKRGPIRIRF